MVTRRKWKPTVCSIGLATGFEEGVLQRTTQQVCSRSYGNHNDVSPSIRFYWPWCKWEIRRWCRHCWSCQQRKPGPGPGRANLYQHPVGVPLERMAVNIMGPLPTTANGNEYGGEMALMLDLMVDKPPVNGQDPPSCPVEFVESNGFGRLVRWRSSLLVRIYKRVWFDRNDCMTHAQTLRLTKLGTGFGSGIHRMPGSN